jgi:hypothetical protein
MSPLSPLTDAAAETVVSPAEMVAELRLPRRSRLRRARGARGRRGEPPVLRRGRTPEPRQPGEIPKVPAGYDHDPTATRPEVSAWREGKIRQHGEWAYWQEGELKGQPRADWLLAKGPKRHAADMERMRRTMLSNRARLAQLRRDGYWFDEEYRLQAPIASAPTGRILVASRAPRSRSARRTSSTRGDPDPSDEPEPPLEAVPLARLRRDGHRSLEGAV